MRPRLQDTPEWELRKDRYDALSDVGICLQALSKGFEAISGGSVRKRIAKNWNQIGIIEKELERRGLPLDIKEE